jgi:hypothetical protein
MGALNIASWGLLAGAIGQADFYEHLFPGIPKWILMAVLFVPWLMVYTISFCRQPPLGPRPFRYCLVFAMCWYAVVTLLAETLYLFVHPATHEHFSITLARVFMYSGALSFIVIVRAYIVLRRYGDSYQLPAERNL